MVLTEKCAQNDYLSMPDTECCESIFTVTIVASMFTACQNTETGQTRPKPDILFAGHEE